jgi:hypothetical protein
MEVEPLPFAGPTCSSRAFYATYVNNKLDLLFVIDDSSAMRPYQAALLANAPVFMNILSALPCFPDVRIAVAHGSDGAFVDPVPCGAQAGARFLEDYQAGYVRNFSGTLSDAFSCLVQVGTAASSPEQSLAITSNALAAHSDFLRDDAYLFVVIIAPEDDVSPEDPQAYAAALRGVKPLPNRILAAAIAPTQVQRLQSFIDAFGSQGVLTSIDQTSWAGAFGVLPSRIMGLIGPQCIEGVLAQPTACTFSRMVDVGTSMERQIGTLPACDPTAPSNMACVALVSDGACYMSGMKLAICYNGYDPANPGHCPDGPNEAVEGEVVTSECLIQCGR